MLIPLGLLIATVCTGAPMDVEPRPLPLQDTVFHYQGGTETEGELLSFAQIAASDDGAPAIIADTMEHDGEWNVFFRTPPGLFEPKGRYFLTLRYRILDRGDNDDDSFYFTFESQQELERYPWAWRSYVAFREDPGEEQRVQQKRVALGPYDDTVLMLGIRNRGRIAIDELRIDRVEGWSRDKLPESEIVVAEEEDYEPYGMCVNFGLPWLYQDDDDIRRAVRMNAEAGIQWLRYVIGWSFLEADQGDIDEDYFRRFDLAMDEADKHGLKYYVTLLGIPRWASPEPEHERFWAFSPTDMDDWRAHVRMVVERYHDRVNLWEVWNEQDWEFWESPLEDFVPLLRATAEAIRSVDPDAQIVIGGLATDGVHGWASADYEPEPLQRLYDAGAAPWFDILAIHTYGYDGVEVTDRINTAWSIMDRNGDGHKRMWINEVGLATVNQRTEADQAAFLEEVYDVALRHPMIDRVFWYNFWCTGEDPDYNEENFGIVNHDFTPRLAYERLKAMPKRSHRVINPELWERDPE